MDAELKMAIFDILGECYAFIQPSLVNFSNFTRSLSRQIQVKDSGNVQFNFDVELDKIIVEGLRSHKITGAIFSEESGFFETAGKRYRVVYDPFCNSSLAARSFREAAIGMSFFTYDYVFITAVVLDLQTGLMALVENNATNFYQMQTGQLVVVEPQKRDNLRDSWVMITLENTDERSHLGEAEKILRTASRIIISSGHIYWLRLAAGFVDAYMDPFGGEELYEMFAATIAQASGCVVTDRKGAPFDPAKALRIFEKDRHFVYYPIAARSANLHAEILSALA
ncbi:MAG TPA: hypothetical protein VMS08_06025 [Candidatus Saccharimonadia bacterium]|nr:hypothetical protein [Candidatus Saccharimonadia bacterium]